MSNKTTVHDSTGNVFADMGMTDAETRLVKAELARAIRKVLEERRLDDGAAAELLGISQPEVSDLTCGKLTRFSVEGLERFRNALDMESASSRPSPEPVGAGITVESVGATRGRPGIIPGPVQPHQI